MKRILILLEIFLALNVYGQNNITDKINGQVYTIASSGNYIYAGTFSHGVSFSTNNGINWTQSSLNDKWITSLTIYGDYIIAGTAGDGIFLSSNKGTNWVKTNMDSYLVNSLKVSGNHIIAAVQDCYNKINDGIYISDDSGITWKQTELSNITVQVLTISGNNVYSGTDGDGIYLSSNNGVNWTQTALYKYSITNIAISGNNIYAETLFSGIYVSTNNGISWKLKNFDQYIHSFAVSGNIIFAAIPDDSSTAKPEVISFSRDNGSNWIKTGLKSELVHSIIINESGIFVLTIMLASRNVYYSKNNGLTWTQF